MSDVVYWLSSAGFAALAYVWAERLGRRAIAWAVACFFFNWIGFAILAVAVLIASRRKPAATAVSAGSALGPDWLPVETVASTPRPGGPRAYRSAATRPPITVEFQYDEDDQDDDDEDEDDEDEFLFEVVGESHHRAALIALLKKWGDAKAGKNVFQRAFAPAALVREPNNKFDKNAVAVHVDGQLVGYVPRDAAAELAAVLGRNGRHECRAMLQGRLDGLIGVTLDADIDELLS
jgi:hypothetical protein